MPKMLNRRLWTLDCFIHMHKKMSSHSDPAHKFVFIHMSTKRKCFSVAIVCAGWGALNTMALAEKSEDKCNSRTWDLEIDEIKVL